MMFKELRERKSELEQLLQTIEKSSKGLPPGRLRAVSRGISAQYYHVNQLNDTKGEYIKAENRKLAEGLAQSDYLKKLQKAAERELRAVSSYLKEESEVQVEDVYAGMNPNRKRLVRPVLLSDEEFVEKWLNEPYVRKEFLPEDSEFHTKKGERVRSKSEILIANMLYDLGIPYRYECPIKLKGYGEVWPDFTLLDIRNRSVKYLEHFGLMHNETYMKEFFWKMSKYSQHGIVLGHSLLMTFEDKDHPLNVKETTSMLKLNFGIE